MGINNGALNNNDDDDDDDGGGNPNGSGGQCNAASTRSVVDEFRQQASGQAIWAREFSTALAKMVELGPVRSSLGRIHTLSAASIVGFTRRGQVALGLMNDQTPELV